MERKSKTKENGVAMDDTDILSGCRGSYSDTLNTAVAKAIEVPIGFSYLSPSPASYLYRPFFRIPAPGFVFLFLHFVLFSALEILGLILLL